MRTLLAAFIAVCAATAQAQQSSFGLASDDAMSDDLRSTVSKVVIKPGASPTEEEVAGSYDKETYDLYSGMAAGSGATTIYRQVGPVNVSIPIPVFQLPTMIAGGIAGATQKEIQDFRDALTDDLAKASNQQLVNEKIASDVYYVIRTAPGLEPNVFARETAIPEDTDAVVYVGIEQLLIDVDGKEATITATVNATVTRQSDEKDVYKTTIHYQDHDTLSNWVENDNAVWRNYANFARHYIGREIAARVFNSAGVEQHLNPVKTRDVSVSKRDPWSGSSKKVSPTLAWELELPGGDDDSAWAAAIDESDITWDLEIYDMQRPVYSMTGIRGPQHTVTAKLQSCQDYRWSVRPAYHVNGETRYGEWMRSSFDGNGNMGKKASEAPAYLYDFAELEIRCSAR